MRFPPETHEVTIERRGERLIIEPVATEAWPESFWQAFGDLPEGFERPQGVPQKREPLEP